MFQPESTSGLLNIYVCQSIAAALINDAIEQGTWPDFLNEERDSEIVTPVPKVSAPQTPDDPRKITCLLNLNKIFEKVNCAHLVEDLKKTLDKSQFANQQGQSMNPLSGNDD